MIVTRSPLRITLGGGGTDLPVYYKEHGGYLIAASINKYVYINLNNIIGNRYIIKYSEYEDVDSIENIKHPIIREIFKSFNPNSYLEFSSMADIPAGTGLGSSGAFTCASLLAMHVMSKTTVSKRELAEEACYIEIDKLGEPIGKQDQYASAFGGINEYGFDMNGTVHVRPLNISKSTLADLNSNLLIFSTGFTRSASSILKEQQSSDNVVNRLHDIKSFGYRSRDALLEGDLDTFGILMHEHWKRKRSTTDKMSNREIDILYDIGMSNGAIGGKLIGAGGGGYLMFYTNEPRRLRKAMTEAGLVELDYTFEQYGSQVILT